MKDTLKNLSEIVARANDLFYSKFEKLDPIMGIIDKALRKQGIEADAITIDCITLDKKIIILIHDDKPGTVGIALGNKDGDIYSSSEYAISEISEELMIRVMEENFIINVSKQT
ncbi:hypothetical protein [Psychromonas sp.]|uniref:hypothetical protein n=1 Tax=Psychromonas sp. TaxID=1884585 RepID=UPI003562EC11